MSASVPMGKTFASMLFLVQFALFCSANQQTDTAIDHSNHIVKIPTVWPWHSIGQIETDSGNLCTAVLISSELVLTAGHCVLTPSGKLDKAIILRFILQNGQWRYTSNKLETLVPFHLAKALKRRDKNWIIPPAAASYDYALIRLKEPHFPLRPIPIWDGDDSGLNQALKMNHGMVTQAGYPEDSHHLYYNPDCPVTGWAQKGVLTHRCYTASGESGSPLLLKNRSGWVMVAIQSSAPAPADRHRADNHALAISAIKADLKNLMQKK